MRVLVTGSRHWTDRRAIEEAFAAFAPTLVITGAAGGADRLADRIAEVRGINRCIWPANWAGYGKGGGPVRNRLMFDEMGPDLVLAFPLTGSVGTRHMISYARSKGCRVLVWGEDFGGE